jgi:molybdopterin/thiamine biosynthesis adenylyltransferase
MEQVQPQLKSITPILPGEDELHLGGCGEVTSIADPDGAVRRLLGLADGTRSEAQIAAALRAEHPHLGDADIAQALRDLDAAGFLEDGAPARAELLDPYSAERWRRNLAFFEAFSDLSRSKYELQREVQTARVALLGVGGLGSHLLLDLAAAGVETLRIVDFDAVELSNLNRQITYAEADIGRPKARAAADRVLAFNPRIDLDVVETMISSADMVESLVCGYDLAISVVDRPTMSIGKWVGEGCVRAGVPLITGGVDSVRAIYYTVLPGATGCVDCWRRCVAESDPASAALLDEKERAEFEADAAAFGPLVTTLTGFMLLEAVRLITGVAPPVGTDKLTEVRFADSQIRVAETWRRHPGCRYCAAAGVPAAAAA